MGVIRMLLVPSAVVAIACAETAPSAEEHGGNILADGGPSDPPAQVAGSAGAVPAASSGGSTSSPVDSGASEPDPDAGPDASAEDCEGCPCEPGTAPRPCDPLDLRTTLNGVSGTLVCSVGSAYCRDGAWSECEILFQYATFVPD